MQLNEAKENAFRQESGARLFGAMQAVMPPSPDDARRIFDAILESSAVAEESSLLFSDVAATTSSIQWMLSYLPQQEGGLQEQDHNRKIRLFAQAMIWNHDKPDVVAHLRTWVDAGSLRLENELLDILRVFGSHLPNSSKAYQSLFDNLLLSHRKMDFLERTVEREKYGIVISLLENCRSLSPFSSHDIAEKFFDILQGALPLTLTNPEQAHITMQWLLGSCLPQGMEKCPIAHKLFMNTMITHHKNGPVLAYLASLAQDYLAGEDFEQLLFNELKGTEYRYKDCARIVNHLSPHVTTLDEKRESPTLKMRLLEWLINEEAQDQTQKALAILMEDCALLGNFSSVEHANIFMNAGLPLEEMVTASHIHLDRVAINIQWLLGNIDQITENPEERAFRKASIIMRAMFHNSTNSVAVAYLSSLLEPTSLTPQLLASMPQFGDSITLQQVFSHLPDAVQDSFARQMTEVALRADYCNLMITFLNMHRPLCESAFLNHLLTIEPTLYSYPKHLMHLFIRFKLGEVTQAQLPEKLRELQPELTRSVVRHGQTEDGRLTRQAEEILFGLFAVSREMRHIEVTEVKDDQGKAMRVGEFKKEPMIEGQSFLAWAIARADGDEASDEPPELALQDYYFGLGKKLYLAGASTKDLEDHPHLEEFTRACNSFDVVAAETMTTLKSELPNMPVHLLEIISAQSQPALPVGDFGQETQGIQRCLDELKRYIPLREAELQLLPEDREDEGLSILKNISNATTLQEILHEIDYYAAHYDGIENSPIADAVIPEEKEEEEEEEENETDEITLADVLNELHGYTIHLRNECGSVPRSPANLTASQQGMEDDDDGRPPAHPAAGLHAQPAESKGMDDNDDEEPAQASEADADKAASHGAAGNGFFSPQNKRKATEDTALPPGPSKHIKTDP